MTNQSIRKELYEKNKDSLEEDMAPLALLTTVLWVGIGSLMVVKSGQRLTVEPQQAVGSGEETRRVEEYGITL